MDKGKISVIVPVYNEEKYLDRCLNSILNQAYQNLEVFLIDDGSTDLSSSICDNYAKQDNRVRVIHKKNEGASVARNLAISLAKGEFLSFIDSDDELRLDAYKILIDTMEEYNVDFIKYSSCIYKEGFLKSQGSKIIKISVIDITSKILKDEYGSQLWQYFFKAYLWKDITSPPGRLAQDMMVIHLATARAKNCLEINENLYYYYQQNPNNVSNNNKNRLRGTVDRGYAFWLRYDFCLSHSEYKSIRRFVFGKAVEFSVSSFVRKEFLSNEAYKSDMKYFLKQIRKNILKILFCPYIKWYKKFGAVIIFVNKNILCQFSHK